MINALIEAVSAALNAEFGDGYEIHMEEIEQDLNEPCFLIQCLEPVSRRVSRTWYFRTNQFCIQYFPESREHPERECHAVGERLFSCLEWLGTESGLRMGTKMKYEVIDKILHFFVNYNGFVYREEYSPLMEAGASGISVKGQVMK